MFDGQFFPRQRIQFGEGLVSPFVLTSSYPYGSITMTAGDPFGFGFYGYADGLGGSISGQPVPGATLDQIVATGGQLSLSFQGSSVTFLTTLYVDDVPYALGTGSYNAPTTQFTILSGGPTFTNGVNYQIAFA